MENYVEVKPIVSDALRCESNAIQEEFDLHRFVLFFDRNIADREYIYETESQILPSFKITFSKNNLPHLMGLQYWSLNIKQPTKQYNKLFDGSWDMTYLRKSDIGAYKENRGRIESLRFLFEMLLAMDCEVKLIHQGIPTGFTRRNIQMIFQKQDTKLIAALELREGNTNSGEYVPASMTMHSRNSKDLLNKHTLIKVKNVEVREIN